MNDSINTIDKLINNVTKLIDEIENKDRARQQLGSLVDDLISYVDTTIQDHPLTQDSIDNLNALELQYGNKKLESVQKSPVIDKFIYDQGVLLANTLEILSRADEVELISDQIGAYTVLASIYGDATGQVPESLGVDLGEAALLKLAELRDDNPSKSNESSFYLKQFDESLQQIKYQCL